MAPSINNFSGGPDEFFLIVISPIRPRYSLHPMSWISRLSIPDPFVVDTFSIACLHITEQDIALVDSGSYAACDQFITGCIPYSRS